jgi:hypothetical protein
MGLLVLEFVRRDDHQRPQIAAGGDGQGNDGSQG